jgi:hypothetical protein
MIELLSVCVSLCGPGFFHIGLLADWVGAQNVVLISTSEGLLALILVCWIWLEMVPRQTIPSSTS